VITLQQLAFALIAILEGLRLEAYQDAGGVWTIGIGHTGPDVHAGMTITLDQALALFAQDGAHVLAMLGGRPVLEGAALASFGFNCGTGALGKILAGTDQQSNPKFTHDMKGHTLPGLVSRRNLERILLQLSRELTPPRSEPSIAPLQGA
jgi:lysozyme